MWEQGRSPCLPPIPASNVLLLPLPQCLCCRASPAQLDKEALAWSQGFLQITMQHHRPHTQPRPRGVCAAAAGCCLSVCALDMCSIIMRLNRPGATCSSHCWAQPCSCGLQLAGQSGRGGWEVLQGVNVTAVMRRWRIRVNTCDTSLALTMGLVIHFPSQWAW